MMYWNLFSLIGIFIFYLISNVSTGAIQITSSNIDSILSSNELVFINFYANWCHFSKMLNPIYDQFADKVGSEYSQKGLVTIGKVDCDKEPSISTKYHVNKYPTLKYFRHGVLAKREYRGAREVNAFVDFIRKQIQSSVIKLSTSNDLLSLEKKKSFIIGHFDNDKSDNYQIFEKVANLLRDDCHFAASINKDQFVNERPINDIVYYRSSQFLNETNEYYNNSINNQQLFYSWSHKKCVPLVREITFENAEELTDEGLPFLILFHHIDDHQSIISFQEQVTKQLLHEISTINCLHADATKFAHPLRHLGKTMSDLPLLAIDSFKHMFLFPDIKQISFNGKLLEFVKDFQLGKLHQDFHKPSPIVHGNGKSVSSPRSSVFVHLSPSRQRYSFRDEL